MSDQIDHERAWQHLWLRVSRLIRGITGTYWSAEVWPEAKKALGWALAELGRLRRSAWWELSRQRALLKAALGFLRLRQEPPEVAPLAGGRRLTEGKTNPNLGIQYRTEGR